MTAERCRTETAKPDSSRKEGGRSIEQILARRRMRKRRRRHTRAPDCLHGSCRVDAVYGTFGARWVETTAFVQALHAADGSRAGWTVATFEEGFLTLAHGLESEVPDADVWLHHELDGTERVVLLDLEREGARVDLEIPSTIPVRTTRERLLQLERSYLNATRDRDFGRAGRGGTNREEQLLESRIDLLSLIGLCARLVGRNR